MGMPGINPNSHPSGGHQLRPRQEGNAYVTGGHSLRPRTDGHPAGQPEASVPAPVPRPRPGGAAPESLQLALPSPEAQAQALPQRPPTPPVQPGISDHPFLGYFTATREETLAHPRFNQQVANFSGHNLYGQRNPAHIQNYDLDSDTRIPPRMGPGPSEVSQQFIAPENGRPASPGNPQGVLYDHPQTGPGRSDGHSYSSGGAFPEMGTQNAIHSHPYSDPMGRPDASVFGPSQSDIDVARNSNNLFRQEGLDLSHHNIQTPAIPLATPQPGGPTHLDPNYLRVYPEGYGVVRPNPDPIGNPNPPVSLDRFNHPDPRDTHYPPTPLGPTDAPDHPGQVYPAGPEYLGRF